VSFSLGNTPTYPSPVQIGTLPPEGSRAVAASIQWNNVRQTNQGYVAQLNFLTQYQSGQFTTVQSVWIDNLSNPWPLIFSVAEMTGQRLYVPANAVGIYPLIVPQAPVFTVQLLYTVGVLTLQGVLPVTNFSFLNTPHHDAFESRFPAYSLTGPAQSAGDFTTPLAFSSVINTPVILAPQSTSQRTVITGIDLRANHASNSAWATFSSVLIYLSQSPSGFFLWSTRFVTTPGGRQGCYVSEDFTTPLVSQGCFANDPARRHGPAGVGHAERRI
jgi:hypothetical protein